MFSKVFNTAKRILSRSPSVQDLRSESREDTPRSPEPDADRDAAMVTTRRGTETPGRESAPRGSVKKSKGKRQLETEDASRSAKKRRKSLEQEGQILETVTSAEPTGKLNDEVSDTIEVAVPPRSDEASPGPNQNEKLPIRRRESPKVAVSSKKSSPSSPTEQLHREATEEALPASTQETELHVPAPQQSNPTNATPAAPQENHSSPTPIGKLTEESAPASAGRSTERNTKPQRDTSDQDDAESAGAALLDEIPSSTWESEQAPLSSEESTPTAPRKAHLHFDDEESADVENQATAINEEQGRGGLLDEPLGDEEDEDASDSDEAPEVVTTASAVSKAKAAEEEAVRAYQAQQAKVERKKEDRAKRIAEEQAERRKREERKAKKAAKTQAKQQRIESSGSHLNVDINNLPALLPDSILEAAGDRRPPTPPPTRAGKSKEDMRKEKLNRHIKFLEQGQKPIKDMKKGSLNVSVLSQQNPFLPPKINKDTRGIREHWLKGRQIEKRHKNGKPKIEHRKVERRQTGGRFLKNED